MAASLLKKVILKCGTPKYYPLKVYCYKSVIDALETFLKRPNFEEACELWRDRQTSEQLYETFTMVQFGSLFTGGIIANFSPYLEALA